MSAYRFTGFYPAHYDTPTGSRMVEPGEQVDWDTPPDGNWAAAVAPDSPVAEAPADMPAEAEAAPVELHSFADPEE